MPDDFLPFLSIATVLLNPMARRIKSLGQGEDAKQKTGYLHREHRSKSGRKRSGKGFWLKKLVKEARRKGEMDRQMRELKRQQLI